MSVELDDLFVQVAIAQELLTREQVERGMAACRAAVQRGLSISFVEWAVAQQIITREQKEELLRSIADEAGTPRLGRYKFTAILGQGRMGSVYEALDTSSGQRFAIRLLRPELCRDMRYIQRLEREARIAAEISHPHVVRLFDMGDELGIKVLAMEFVEGDSLAAVLARKGPLDVPTATRIIHQIAKAMEHYWKCQIIHRDIKPTNILLATDGKAKLSDLGLAKPLSGKEAVTWGESGSSLAYMAPELARGEREIDIRVDIYGLGATFFHLVTGEPPLQAQTLDELLRAHSEGEVPSPKVSSPAISELIGRMMATEREKRFPDPSALLATLSRMEMAPEESLRGFAISRARSAAEKETVRPEPAESGEPTVRDPNVWCTLPSEEIPTIRRPSAGEPTVRAPDLMAPSPREAPTIRQPMPEEKAEDTSSMPTLRYPATAPRRQPPSLSEEQPTIRRPAPSAAEPKTQQEAELGTYFAFDASGQIVEYHSGKPKKEEPAKKPPSPPKEETELSKPPSSEATSQEKPSKPAAVKPPRKLAKAVLSIVLLFLIAGAAAGWMLHRRHIVLQERIATAKKQLDALVAQLEKARRADEFRSLISSFQRLASDFADTPTGEEASARLRSVRNLAFEALVKRADELAAKGEGHLEEAVANYSEALSLVDRNNPPKDFEAVGLRRERAQEQLRQLTEAAQRKKEEALRLLTSSERIPTPAERAQLREILKEHGGDLGKLLPTADLKALSPGALLILAEDQLARAPHEKPVQVPALTQLFQGLSKGTKEREPYIAALVEILRIPSSRPHAQLLLVKAMQREHSLPGVSALGRVIQEAAKAERPGLEGEGMMNWFVETVVQGSREMKQKEAAINILSDLEVARVLPGLNKLLRSPDPELYGAAAETTLRMGTEAVPSIVGLILPYAGTQLAEQAATALVKIGEPAVSHLVYAMSNRTTSGLPILPPGSARRDMLRARAAEVIAKMGAQAVPSLFKFLGEPAAAEDARSLLVGPLKPHAIEFINARFPQATEAERKEMITLLLTLRDSKNAEMIENLLSSTDERARRGALAILVESSPETTPLLEALLKKREMTLSAVELLLEGRLSETAKRKLCELLDKTLGTQHGDDMNKWREWLAKQRTSSER